MMTAFVGVVLFASSSRIMRRWRWGEVDGGGMRVEENSCIHSNNNVLVLTAQILAYMKFWQDSCICREL